MPSAGADHPGQPEADRNRRRRRVGPMPSSANTEVDRGDTVGHGGSAADGRLRGSVAIHRRAARRPDNPTTGEHEPRVLRLVAVQQADRSARRPFGQARYDAYGRLAVDIAANAAPLAAFAVPTGSFSFRAVSVVVQATAHSGLELTGLCLEVDRTETHTNPSSATAIPHGLLPMRIVATTFRVRGSMRETVPSPLFATQTLAAP